ncbi:MAG: hypothetical protein ACKO85_05180, partial [Isosphaeraceae bacterium]
YELSEELAGRKVQCRSCATKFRVGPVSSNSPAAQLSESDTISIRCPRCLADYQLKPKYAGKSVRCRDCKTPFDVPASRANSTLQVTATEELSTSAFSSGQNDPAPANPPVKKARLVQARPTDNLLDASDLAEMHDAPAHPGRRIAPRATPPTSPLASKSRSRSKQGASTGKVVGVVSAVLITMFTITLQRMKRAAIRNVGSTIVNRAIGSDNESTSPLASQPTAPAKRFPGELHPEFQRMGVSPLGSPVPNANLLADNFPNRDLSVLLKYNEAKVGFINSIAAELKAMKAPGDPDFRKHLFETNSLWQRVAGKTAFNIAPPFVPHPKEERELARLLGDSPSRAVDAVFQELQRLDSPTFRYKNLVLEFAEVEKACVKFENQFQLSPLPEKVDDYLEVCVAGISSLEEGLYIKDELHRLTNPKYSREIIHYQQVDRYSLWPVKDIDKVARQIKFGDVVRKQGREVLVEARPIDPAVLKAWKQQQKQSSGESQKAPAPTLAVSAKRQPVFAALTSEQVDAMPFFQLGLGVASTPANAPGLADAARMREMATTTLPQGGPTLAGQIGPQSGPVIKKYSSVTYSTIAPDPPIPPDADDLTRGMIMIRSQHPFTRRKGYGLLKTADFKGQDAMVLEKMKEILEEPTNLDAPDAVAVIARCNAPGVVKLLCGSLNRPLVSTEIINILERKKDPESFRPLIDAMDNDLLRRIDPVLISFGPAVEHAVLAKLAEPQSRIHVLGRCCDVLAEIGTTKSIETLEKYTTEPKVTIVNESAAAALKAVKGRIR